MFYSLRGGIASRVVEDMFVIKAGMLYEDSGSGQACKPCLSFGSSIGPDSWLSFSTPLLPLRLVRQATPEEPEDLGIETSAGEGPPFGWTPCLERSATSESLSFRRA